MIRHRVRSPQLAVAALVAALLLAGCSASTASSSAAASAVAASPSALALQQQFVKVVKQVGPSVVLIQTSQGLGSGVVFDANGDVVTNAPRRQGGQQLPGHPGRREAVPGPAGRQLRRQ